MQGEVYAEMAQTVALSLMAELFETIRLFDEARGGAIGDPEQVRGSKFVAC